MVIPFEQKYREEYFSLINEIFDSNFWSEGKMLKQFEKDFEKFCNIPSRAVTNGGTGLLSIFEYINVKDCDVLVPTNTFWATTQAIKKAGGNPIFVDCNKNDLCISYEDIIKKVTKNTKAIVVVHIGGHIAFDIEKITSYCNENNIYLVEDCAHAHGAVFNGKSAGSWGFAGSYSFYATKTMPTGDGGMVVSKDQKFLDWLEKYRNYGKEVIDGKVTYPIKDGFNYRMNEFTAALGIVQLKRMPEILKWKRDLAKKYDKIFENRVILPYGMVSGYYKYIVFGYDIKEQTGQVFGINDLGHNIDNRHESLPNSQWVVENHKCPPMYYGWDKANLSVEEIKNYIL
jgi:dTDP-4-amino-4,6-dideoxygalactose transaminase